MEKQELKDAEEYLNIRSVVHLAAFTKELDSYIIEPNYLIDFEVSENAEIKAGSRLDLLLMGHCLAEAIFNNEITLSNKIKFLETIALIANKTVLNLTSEMENIVSEMARKNAFKRHKETYELKKQAIEHWCNNIDLNLSNDKAAAKLAKIVPVTIRILSGYVAEAKRQNIHPASKV